MKRMCKGMAVAAVVTGVVTAVTTVCVGALHQGGVPYLHVQGSGVQSQGILVVIHRSVAISAVHTCNAASSDMQVVDAIGCTGVDRDGGSDDDVATSNTSSSGLCDGANREDVRNGCGCITGCAHCDVARRRDVAHTTLGDIGYSELPCDGITRCHEGWQVLTSRWDDVSVIITIAHRRHNRLHGKAQRHGS